VYAVLDNFLNFLRIFIEELIRVPVLGTGGRPLVISSGVFTLVVFEHFLISRAHWIMSFLLLALFPFGRCLSLLIAPS